MKVQHELPYVIQGEWHAKRFVESGGFRGCAKADQTESQQASGSLMHGGIIGSKPWPYRLASQNRLVRIQSMRLNSAANTFLSRFGPVQPAPLRFAVCAASSRNEPQ
jgi:hypothetical protein